jgi:hypothetical protein
VRSVDREVYRVTLSQGGIYSDQEGGRKEVVVRALGGILLHRRGRHCVYRERGLLVLN